MFFMKTILIFKLPEEKEELKHAQNGTNYAGFIDDFESLLRNKEEYSEHKDITWGLVREAYYNLKRESDI